VHRLLRYAAANYGPLARNMAHQFAQDHALHVYPSNAVYSFIPKNGCSTLRVSIAMTNGCIGSLADGNWIHKNNGAFRADLRALATAEYTFTVLRCPFRRLASVYLDKIVSRDLELWALWEACGRRFEIEALSFEAFVDILGRPAALKASDHWRLQKDFLVYQEYDDYFRLEDFPRAVARLEKRIGFEVIDARPLTRHGIGHLEPIEREDFSTTRPVDILSLKASGRCPAPECLYTEALVERVRKLYREDIALYLECFGESGLLFG